MSKLSSFLIFIICSTLITACGYSDFNECMREEIKQNSGQKNKFISNFCRSEFENILEYGEDYKIDILYGKYTEADSYDELEVFNQSNLDIHTLKFYYHLVEQNSNCKKNSEVDWSKEKNYTLDRIITSGERFRMRVVTPIEYGLTKSKKRCVAIFAAGG